MIQTRTPPTSIAGDAEFRTWGQNISQMLAAAGFVKTADTGQIDWATVARPGTINTAAGYEIWRFDDPLQADFPIFFKLEYGVGSAVTNTALWLTVGTSSDGAGNINSTNTTTRLTGTQTTSPGASVQRMSSDDGRLAHMTTGVQQTSNAGFVIERLRDVNGDFTDDGVYVALFNNNNGMQIRTLRNGVTPPTVTESVAGCLTPSSTPSFAGLHVGMFPWHPIHGPVHFPIVSVMSYFGGDVPALTEIPITRQGVEHNYLFTNIQSSSFSARGVGTTAVALLWE